MGSHNQSFELKWQHHETNLKTNFNQLLVDESFVDATLVCGEASLKVHQVVLSAASPYLRRIFLDHPTGHPVIILQDLDESGLRCLVNFIYRGEVQIPIDRLHALLRCAQTLKITGFIDACRKNEDGAAVDIEPHDQRLHDAGSDCIQHSDNRNDDLVDADAHPCPVSDPNLQLSVLPEQRHVEELSDNNQMSDECPDRYDSEPGTFSRRRGRHRRRRLPDMGRNRLDDNIDGHYLLGTDECSVTVIKREVTSPLPAQLINVDGHQRPEIEIELLSSQPDPWTGGSELSGSEVMTDGVNICNPDTDNEMSVCSVPNSLSQHYSPGSIINPSDNVLPIQEITTKGPSRSGFSKGLSFRSATVTSGQYHSFRTTGGAVSGIARAPAGVKQYRCHMCPKTSNRKFNMIQHMNTHNPFRETHACPICQRVYQRKGELVRHHKKVHEDGDNGS